MLFDAAHDAELLRKATKSSWSTDHKLLIHVVAENERTNEQMQEFRRAFVREYKKCPIEAVQKATNLPHQSAYSKALVATLLTREECAAQNLHLAMKGLGTDERAMIQILAHSTKEEVELIKATYLRMYHKTLEADITDDTSGVEKKFFLGLINAPRSRVDLASAEDEIQRDVKELYLAGQAKWSSDISAFVKIITKHDNEYLAALNLAYGRVYGDTLIRAVEKEINSGCLAKGMKAMIMDRADFYASELHWVISGAGTNTDTLTRIIATQRHTIPAICHRYMNKFGKNLRHHMEQENAVKDTQYGKVILSLLKVAEAAGTGSPTGSNNTPHVQPSQPPPSHSGPPPALHPYSNPGYPQLVGQPGHSPASGPGAPPPAYTPPGYPPAPYGAPPPGHPSAPYGAPPSGAPQPGYPPAHYGAPPSGYPPPSYGAPPPGAPPPGYSHPAPYGAPPGATPPGYPSAPYGAPPAHGAPPPGYPPVPYGAPPAYGAPPPGYPPAPYGAPGATPGHGMPQYAPNPHYPPPPAGYPTAQAPLGAYPFQTGHEKDKNDKKDKKKRHSDDLEGLIYLGIGLA